MAISIANLKRVRADRPPRMMIIAPQGMGKTTLGSEFPEPAFLQFEEGTPAGMELDSFGLLSSYNDGIDAISALYSEDHRYRTVVVDSVDKLEPLLWAEICARNKWASIEAPGYGKGYKEADYLWREFLDGLLALRRDRDMNIVLLAHTEVTRFDDPQTASYSRYVTRLHSRAAAILEDEMDAILFINQDASIKEEDQGFGKKRTRAESGSTRWIYTEQRPAFVAKNRYGMPPKILFNKGQGYTELAKYIPEIAPAAEPAAA